MRLLSLIYIFTIFLTNTQFALSQVEYKEVKVKIEVEKVENMFSITGTVENLKSEFKNISYKLSVFKSNKSNSNNSKNVQDGRITLEPIQKVILSKTQVNGGQEDRIILLLMIYDEKNVVIGKDRIVIGEEEEKKTGSVKPKDGLEMTGIVSNDTKTKLGNDFYDFFYSEYSKLNINSNKIVTIQEELTFGRTTRIIVSMDGEIVDEFITRPDEDFLKYMAQNSSAKVFKYVKRIEEQNKLIIRY